MKALVPALLLASILFIGCGGNSTPPPPPPTITGTWSGSAASAVFGGSSGIKGNLVQGVTNPDGSILFSGTLNLTNSCITTLTITNGQVAGGQFSLTGGAQDGTTFSISATINAQDTAITGNWSDVAGNVCATDHGTLSLTKQ